ncbi:MAG TPA: dipeptide epimerase [Chitinophagaceae bacterium]|nr:dipeptide epimerase [Chitinophagaceae bacterium]
MKINKTEIYKLTIKMEPFVIATEVSYYTQNIFIRIHTDKGITGMGECSAFPMLVGETQNTCFEVAKDFAKISTGKDPLDIEARMQELHDYIAFNSTIKSAWDMALHDIASKHAGVPLYKYLGGMKKTIMTDLTIGIDTPESMQQTARAFVADGVKIIKVKLGKNGREDVKRIKQIREAIGPDIKLRVDANQGWHFEEAVATLQALEQYDIQYCEQPIRHQYDALLPALRKLSPIKIMADESVFDHYDAIRLIEANAVDYINIKLAKSGGLLEAKKIADEAGKRGIACMMGGMLESRLGLTAKVHFAMANDNIVFYDLDTCLLGQLEDPVIGGAQYNNYFLEISEEPGIAADISESFLSNCEKIII